MNDRKQMKENNSLELLDFPCTFPIKMMGRDNDEFRTAALEILGRHTGDLPDTAVKTTPSSKGNFISITATINAQSRTQLDAIYRDLSEHEDILVAL